MSKTLDDFFEKGSEKGKVPPKKIKLFNMDKFKDEDWTFKRANTKELTHFIFSDYPASLEPRVSTTSNDEMVIIHFILLDQFCDLRRL